MPLNPQDLLDTIHRLERRVHALEGRAHIRPAMDQVINGDVIVGEGGSFVVRDPHTGVDTFRVGEFQTPSGGGEFGVVVRRRDGSQALSVWNGTSNEGEAQPLRMHDASGNLLFSDDVVAGGLARPYIPFPDLANDDTSSWPMTQSTAWKVLQQGDGIAQHPKVSALVSSASSGPGEFRLLINDVVVATSTTASPIKATVAVPDFEYLMPLNFKVEARVASAADGIWVQCRYLYGVQS